MKSVVKVPGRRMGAASRWCTADQGSARCAARGLDVHYRALVLSCLDAARLTAPRPIPHRVNVVPLTLWWSLVLADAVCCPLVEVVRSGPHARGGTLGFFSVTIVFEQAPALPWADSATIVSMSIPALPHASPDGRADVTSTVARTATCPEGWLRSVALRSRPCAGASVKNCSARTSISRTVIPWDLARVAMGKRPCRAPRAAARMCDGTHPLPSNGVTRLAARGAAGVYC